MSILSKNENRCVYDNLEQFSNNSNYLWSEIYSNQKYQNNSTKEDSFSFNNNNNNTNQLLQIHEPKSILDSKFYLIKKIGQGSSGKVYLGIHKDSLSDQNNNMKYYSIKIMNADKIDLDVFKNEIELLEKINHKNVLKIFAYGYGPKVSLDKNKNKQPKEFYYIVMEYLSHGELYKYITDVVINENIGFGENFGRLIFSQLLDGLEALHNLNICHRDIKLNNILIGENDYILKYVDFGMGTEQQGLLHKFLGTPNYAAPELHLKIPYYGKSEDIFSLGITLFVLVTGRLPFKLALPNDTLYQYIARGDYIEFWKNKSIDLSPSFMELFDNMVAFDFTQRPSISEIRQSTWMKEINLELMPLLKQEFILREEKIKINESNRQIIINEKKYINSNFESNESEINKSINNVKESLTKDNSDENTNKEESEENSMNKSEGKFKIKTTSRNLYMHLSNIKRFLKKEGYVRFGGSIKNYELEVTNGEIDIYFHLQKQKQGYVLLNYYIKNGTFQSFEKFKNLIVNIRHIIEK
jgi:serine/threonine protein kinase